MSQVPAVQPVVEQPEEPVPGVLVTNTGNTFRFGGKRYFLTYSQVGERDIALVAALMEEKRASSWHAVRESHRDGGFHWHALAFWDKGFRGRGASALDIDGIHPNIRSLPREADVKRVWDYMHKEDTAIHMGPYSGPDTGVAREKLSKNAAWHIIADAKSKDAARDMIFKYDPHSYFNLQDKWGPALDRHFEEERVQYVPSRGREAFNKVPQILWDWVAENIDAEETPERPKALVIWGPTRLGKTDWARCLGRHMYHNGMFNLDLWDQEADFIIFDDMNEKNFAIGYKQWFGGQKEFTLTDKYRHKRTVKWGKPTIWLSNTDPLQSPHFDVDWLAGNVVNVYLDERLWEDPIPEPNVEEMPFDWPPTPIADLLLTPAVQPPPIIPLQDDFLPPPPLPILNSQITYLEDLY